MKGDLYTYILEFKGGTYITQVEAKTIGNATKKWLNYLEQEYNEITHLDASSVKQIRKNLRGDMPTAITDTNNVWNLSFYINQKESGLINIIKTSKN